MLSKAVLRFRPSIYRMCKQRSNYIVLLPEVPPDTPTTNPLLRDNPLPQFSEMTSERCVGAIRRLLIEYEAGVHQIDQQLRDPDVPRNVQGVILSLDRLSGRLDFAWGAFKVLYTVQRNRGIAETYTKLHPQIVKAKREKYLSSSLYKAFMELNGGEEGRDLSEPLRRIVDRHLLEARLSGMSLSGDAYKHFLAAVESIERHRKSFKWKLDEVTSMFSHNLEFNDVRNFPRDLLRLVATDRCSPSKGPWRLSLEAQTYESFMQYCDDRLLRWNAWRAYNTRASPSSGQDFNNSIEIEEIRHQRHELARLLGYESFAALSMSSKMAGSVENVTEMLTTLRVRSERPTADQIRDLQDFASRGGFIDALAVWDVPYLRRLHREELFGIDDEHVRQYFPFPSVLGGLFELCRSLFNVRIEECGGEVDAWHEGAKLYKIYDDADQEIACFFLDPYSRSGDKAPGANLMEVGRSRSDLSGSLPLAYLVFSFPQPSAGEPCLLSFSDLKTLMKKFGHLLQHCLTAIPYGEVSGLSNLEWDTVHVCPLVMSAFLGHHPLASRLSGHLRNGERLPRQLHQRLMDRDAHMSGLRLREELYRSALDLEMYRTREFWVPLSKRMWSEYLPFPYEKDSAQPCSFHEIFSGQYPAAYYSNLWAQVVAADVFDAFREAGLDSEEGLQQTGLRFRSTFLALGGGCHPGEVFRRFRGRDPSPDALLASLGLANDEGLVQSGDFST